MRSVFSSGSAIAPWCASHHNIVEASISPTTAPPPDRIKLSVSSCRTIRTRLAPSAPRIANSFERAAALASNRLDRFTHAISMIIPTAPHNILSALRSRPLTHSLSGTGTTASL